jgi:hypothetical protein
MKMLRRQRHASGIDYCKRVISGAAARIREINTTLDDLQLMMAKIEKEDLLRGYIANEKMWKMLDDLVWNQVDEKDEAEATVLRKQNNLRFVLRQNHNHDEDEAWEEYGFCGLPLIGQKLSIRDIPRQYLQVVYPGEVVTLDKRSK